MRKLINRFLRWIGTDNDFYFIAHMTRVEERPFNVVEELED